MKKYIIFLTILLNSCSVPNWYKPHGYILFSQMPKNGSPGYNLGWLHGCQSGAGTQFGGAIYLTAYTWHRDVDITSSKPNIEVIKKRYKKELKDVNWNDPDDIKRNFNDYNMVFWDAHAFCRATVLGTVQTAGMNPVLPGDARFVPGGHNLGSVWDISSKGDARWGSPAGTGGYW